MGGTFISFLRKKKQHKGVVITAFILNNYKSLGTDREFVNTKIMH
jgi:hypothetical protein